jgi:hypothetical protein
VDYQLQISDLRAARAAFAAAGWPIQTVRGVLIFTGPLVTALGILERAGVQVLRQWPPAPVAPCLARGAAGPPAAAQGSGDRVTTTNSPA